MLTLFECAMFIATNFAVGYLLLLEDYCNHHPEFSPGADMPLAICQTKRLPIIAMLTMASMHWFTQIITRVFQGVKWCYLYMMSAFGVHED